MVEALYDASAAKCFSYHLGREYPSHLLSLLRRKIEDIHGVDNDLPVPILENLRDTLVSGKWDSEENNLSSRSVCNRLGNDAWA